MTAEGRGRGRTWVVLGLLAFLALLPLRGLLRNQGPPMEEGFMLVFPERVLHGALPNRGFLHLYGPGSLWALAATYKVFGVRLVVERLFGFAQQMAVVAGVYLLARRWGRVAAFFCAAASCVIIMPPIGLTALAWVGAVGLGLLALDAVLAASGEPDERRRKRLVITAGLLAGFALLFRVDLIVAIGLAGIVATRTLSKRDRKTLYWTTVAGVSPYVIHLATAGPGHVLRGMVLDPIIYLRGGRRLSIPPPPSHLEGWLQRAGELRKIHWPFPVLRSPAQLTVWFFVLLFAVFALAFTGWRLVRADRTSARGRALFAVGLFSAGMLPQAVQRTDSTHFAWVSCVPVALLPLALIEWSRLRVSWSPRTRAAVAGVLVLGLLAFVIPRYTVQQFTDYVAQTFGVHREAYKIQRGPRVFYYGKKQVALALPPLMRDLDRYSRKGDSLLVGTVDLRKTPYSDAFLYYLYPELKPATYYIEMDPGVANAKNSRLTDEVRKADFLVLSSVWDNWVEPNDSRNFGPNAPNEVVKKSFCRLGSYNGQYQLYERCDLARARGAVTA
ncbi:MAG: hypothetical protein JWL83_3669 [Actinomycetia bacterium]|nr:hypothetical protein [Actinomycetes bacterium]